MNRFGATLLVFMTCLVSFPAMAELTSMRLCSEEDLSGQFRLVYMQEKPQGEEWNWYQNFRAQYMVFYPGHTYNFVASRVKMKSEADLKAAMVKSLGDSMRQPNRKFTLDGNGLLNLYLEERLEYSFRCMVSLVKSGHLSTGDLIFSGYSKRNTGLYKVFRRWPDNDPKSK